MRYLLIIVIVSLSGHASSGEIGYGDQTYLLSKSFPKGYYHISGTHYCHSESSEDKIYTIPLSVMDALLTDVYVGFVFGGEFTSPTAELIKRKNKFVNYIDNSDVPKTYTELLQLEDYVHKVDSTTIPVEKIEKVKVLIDRMKQAVKQRKIKLNLLFEEEAFKDIYEELCTNRKNLRAAFKACDGDKIMQLKQLPLHFKQLFEK